jgi:hypothetical protein
MSCNPYYSSRHWRGLRAAALERDRHTCVVAGCGRRAIVVDHIETRPLTPLPCEADRLENLRSLCASHDASVKERGGRRRQGGAFKVKGCDAEGRSVDPSHVWRK